MPRYKTRQAHQTKTHGLAYHERPESNLVTIPIRDIADAGRVFGEKTSKGYTPLVLVPGPRETTDFVMKLPHGFDSIITENGSTIGVFRPGRYYRSYFFQVSYLVNKQRIPYHFAVKSCPTRDNVRVDVYVDFLFHVADSMKFVTQISAENMEELLRATQAESVRSLVRNARVDQVLDLRGMNSDDMLMTLNDKLNPYGFTIDQVTIASVHLPEDVTERLQNTTTFESKQQLQEKAQELQMRQLNGKQYYEAVRQQRVNEKQRAEEVAKKNRAAIQQEINALQSKSSADLERIQDGLYNQVAQIEATRELDIGRINAERDKLCAEVRAEGTLRVNEFRLDAERYDAQVRSETLVKLAENRAKILAIRAEAEHYAAQRIKARREFDIGQRRLLLLRALAANPDTVIVGEGADNFMATLLSSSRSTAALGLGKGSK